MKKKTKIVLLLFSLFLSIPNVLAANSNYVSGTYSLYTYDYNVATGASTNANWASYKNITEETTFSTSKSIGRGAIRLYGGSNFTYQSAFSYIFKINFKIGTANEDVCANFSVPALMYSTSTSTTNTSFTEMSTDKYKATCTSTTSGSYKILTLKLIFKPPVDIRAIQISFLRSDPKIVLNSFKIENIEITYDNNDGTLVAGAVEDQTTIIENKTTDIINKQEELKNSINNDKTDEATSKAGEFFSGFETNTFGLTSIITAPLNLIGSITSSTCSPLGLKIPFMSTNKTLDLPCLSSIYQQHFGTFLTIYQTITFGIVAYWVCVRIFALVKDFKNPDHDEIEVLDL